MFRIFFALLLCVYALSVEGAISDCGSKVGDYSAVTISDCDSRSPSCILKRGTNATISITFDIDSDVTGVTAVVHGVIAGVPVPFAIAHPKACEFKNSGLQCPLDKNKGPFTYVETLYVEPTYPRLSLKIKWELKDENSQDIVCVEVPAKIQ